MDDQTRNLFYASLQDEWSFAKGWELTPGVRYDNYSDFGSTVNPRIALVWQTITDLTTKLLYGSAFRPPSFNELYVKNNPSNTGNPDLTPETIQTLELVFDYRPGTRLHASINLFAYEIKDLIELVQDPDQTAFTTQNHKDQEGQGFEIEADWLVTDALRVRGIWHTRGQRTKKPGTGP
jgi:iron complex outermembrane receptor protein